MSFRNFYIYAAIAIAMCGLSALTSSDAMAQATATGTANINALINNPIQLTVDQDLNFGSAAPSTAATTVSIAANGTVSGTAIGQGGTQQQALFTVSGLPNQNISVVIPAGDVTISDGGTNTMIVNGWGTNAPASIPAGGSQQFGVGATLNIGAEQAAGTYTGTFDVTVSYN